VRTGSGWGAPTNIAGANRINSISCTIAAACLAVTESDAALRFNGTSWSTQSTVLTHTFGTTVTPEPLRFVSCSATGAATGCIAVDKTMDYAPYNGGWGTQYDNYLSALGQARCASATFCVASDGRRVAFYNSGTWSAPEYLDGSTFLTDASCVSSTFCVFTDFNAALIWNGTTLSAPVVLGPLSATDVSCASTTFCMARLGDGTIRQYNGTRWLAAVQVDNAGGSVSCTARTFCMTIGASEKTSTWNGHTWSALVGPVNATQTSGLSCASPTLCVVTSFSPSIVSFDGTSWTSTVIDAGNAIDSAVCVHGARVCFAADNNGGFLTKNGTKWKRTTPGLLENLTCPTTSFCMASGANGGLRIGQPAA